MSSNCPAGHETLYEIFFLKALPISKSGDLSFEVLIILNEIC